MRIRTGIRLTWPDVRPPFMLAWSTDPASLPLPAQSELFVDILVVPEEVLFVHFAFIVPVGDRWIKPWDFCPSRIRRNG